MAEYIRWMARNLPKICDLPAVKLLKVAFGWKWCRFLISRPYNRLHLYYLDRKVIGHNFIWKGVFMISAKSIQQFYLPLRLLRFRAANRLHSLKNKPEKSQDITEESRLSREKVIEIYDWIAKLNAQSKGVWVVRKLHKKSTLTKFRWRNKMDVTNTILIFDVIALLGIMISSAVYLYHHKYH